jgi:hypothetical protein
MKVDFFRAILREDSTSDVRMWCAITPFGVRALKGDEEAILSNLSLEDLSRAESIVTVDLSGLDRVSLEAITDIILKSGLLGKPGVKGKGEAVLFMLANEALHALAQVMRDEEAESDPGVPSGTRD